MSVGVVIAAAGSGTRLGRGSKALVELEGRTLLARALDLFLAFPEVERIVVVAPAADLESARAETAGMPAARVSVCAGGATRQESVAEGLRVLGPVDHVLVHDAARPLASRGLVERVLAAAIAGGPGGAAIPGLPPRDAVKTVAGGTVVSSLERDRLVLVQTPQGFAYPLLVEAHRRAVESGLAGDDDARLVEEMGTPVQVVPGEAANIKVTTPADLELVVALLREQHSA